MEEHRNVVLLGPPGVGKTHLAIALGIAATEAGYRTYFTGALDLAQSLQSAHLEGTAQYKLRTYVGPSVLVIDELGYLPLDQASANWIFQVVSRRYEREVDHPHQEAAASATGRRSSPIRSSPAPSSTAFCIAPRCSTSRARAIGCVPTRSSRRPGRRARADMMSAEVVVVWPSSSYTVRASGSSMALTGGIERHQLGRGQITSHLQRCHGWGARSRGSCMTIPNDAGVCHITIYVRDDALAQLLQALPLDFRIRHLPPHPDDSEGAGWQLDYRGVWTIEQDNTLDSLDDLVTSWGRSGLPLRLRSTPHDE